MGKWSPDFGKLNIMGNMRIMKRMGLVGLMGLMGLWFCGCKTREVVVVEHHTDTCYVDRWQRDSVYVEKEKHDSVFIHQKGDTVWVEKYRTEYRDRWREKLVHDSVYIARCDTVVKEVVKEVAKKENFFTKMWRQVQVPFTIVGFVAVVMGALWLVMKMKR